MHETSGVVFTAQNCAENGVWGFQPRTRHIIPKNGLSENGLNIFLLPRGQKSGFQHHTDFAETTANAVPRWRGRKHNFCTRGSEIGHLRSGSKRVMIQFSFHCTSFPIHLQEHKENCLVFLPFCSWTCVHFYHVFLLEYCCTISTCVPHGPVQSLCSCWCLLRFFCASASDYLHSFHFLHIFSVFLLCFFIFIAFLLVLVIPLILLLLIFLLLCFLHSITYVIISVLF